MSLVPFAYANDIGDRFLKLLADLDINPANYSNMEDELLSLTNLIELYKNPTSATDVDKVNTLRSAAGFHDFAAKILSARELPEFCAFVVHLKMLAGQKNGFTSLIQNYNAQQPNDVNRKLTELYLASLVGHISVPNSLKLDDPEESKGDNPDILFKSSADEQSKDWALAVKSVSAKSGQTYFDRIQEAAKQIDSPNCKADIGMIIINMKDTIDHESLWETVFKDVAEATAAFKLQIEERINKAKMNRPQDEWDNLFTGKVVRPIIFMAHTLVRIDTLVSNQTPTTLKIMVSEQAHGEPSIEAMRIACALNHLMQILLDGEPFNDQFIPC